MSTSKTFEVVYCTSPGKTSSPEDDLQLVELCTASCPNCVVCTTQCTHTVSGDGAIEVQDTRTHDTVQPHRHLLARILLAAIATATNARSKGKEPSAFSLCKAASPIKTMQGSPQGSQRCALASILASLVLLAPTGFSLVLAGSAAGSRKWSLPNHI